MDGSIPASIHGRPICPVGPAWSANVSFVLSAAAVEAACGTQPSTAGFTADTEDKA